MVRRHGLVQVARRAIHAEEIHLLRAIEPEIEAERITMDLDQADVTKRKPGIQRIEVTTRGHASLAPHTLPMRDQLEQDLAPDARYERRQWPGLKTREILL